MARTKHSIIGLIAVVLTTAGLYAYNPVSWGQISTVEGFTSYARSFGQVITGVIFFITTIQAIIPVIPFVILCIANGILFGIFKGTLLTLAGTMAGASITFFVSRRLGHQWVDRFYQDNSLRYFDKIEGFRGFFVVLGMRLLPYFPAPLINISAGVSRIRFFWFFLASAIGKLPFILGYGILGYSVLSSKNYMLGIGLMALLIVLPFTVVFLTRKRA